MATITAREFNRDVSAAKRAATSGPVVITDRGEPAFVLLSIQDYQRLGESGAALIARVSMEDEIDIEFEPVRVDLKAPDL